LGKEEEKMSDKSTAPESKPWLTPWHKASYDRFINERLPELLAERLPLAGYSVEPQENAPRRKTIAYWNGDVQWAPSAGNPATCRVTVTLAAASGALPLVYSGIYQPDEDGLFEIDGELRWICPTASDEYLETARMACVGEHLYELIARKLGQAPESLPWDEALARAWLPLDAWINDYLRTRGQVLDQTNWLARNTHNRRFTLLKRDKVYARGQNGRVCPFETPENPNIGGIFTPAVGAQIQGDRLVIIDPRPAATLGLSASMLPFIENNDPNRILMAANMLRQAIVPAHPEPAWVQTGNEPDATGFWCGRNLLTAFVSWGEGTSEDGIILSESAARRLNDPFPVEPGDKLANRHGAFGVVSQILPDEKMPHLANGTPVELVFNFIGLRTRMQVGLVREAVMSQVARAEGKPAIVPPFEAPGADELRQRMVQAGLPETGMETLTQGKQGPALERPSTIGWIYWNRLAHLAQRKIHTSIDGSDGQPLGELDAILLRELGAVGLLAEMMGIRTIRRVHAQALAQQLTQGPVEPAGPPTPLFATLAERLRMAGIQAELLDGSLRFRFASPQGKTLKLAHALPHPWLRTCSIDTIGIPAGKEGERPPFTGLIEANARLERLLSSQVPGRLLKEAEARLQTQLKACLDALVPPDGYSSPDEEVIAFAWETPAETGGISELLRIDEPQCFSGRAVAAPGIGLRLDQVGLPEELCWKLFGPLVERELKAPVQPGNPQAAQILDVLMAQQWVIIQRAPALAPTALLAFHPVRDPARVIRLNPLVCDWLNTDFDGNQIAVHLPVTAAAQLECQELLSVNGQLKRNPGLIKTLLPCPEVLWGLAYHALTQPGREEVASIAGVAPETLGSLLTQANFIGLMETVLERNGVHGALEILQTLTNLGYLAVRNSGASMNPFFGSSQRLPPVPLDDTLAAWETYSEELAQFILASTDYADLEMGPQRLDTHVRPLRWRSMTVAAGIRGVSLDENGQRVIVKHGNSQGLTPAELLVSTVGARQGLANLFIQSEQLVRSALTRSAPTNLTVLARARHARQPGIVFARAAANEEVDLLEDPLSRLLVGLPLTGRHV
jgi:hypothetical protein